MSKVGLKAEQVLSKSYPLAVLLPGVVWFIFTLHAHGNLLGAFGMAFYSVFIHSIFYAFIGLPLFSCLVKKPHSLAWDTMCAMLLGFAFSGGVLFIIVTILSGSTEDFSWAIGVLGAHGAWTGFAASRAKRKLESEVKND